MHNLIRQVLAPTALFAVLVFAGSFAQSSSAGLSEDLIQQLQSDFADSGRNPAMYNALTVNDISALAVNRDRVVAHNSIFNKEITTG
ncbi:MAG: hypothetical protein WBP42_14170, partial [Candidatus Zixiibacteriota bacterium]